MSDSPFSWNLCWKSQSSLSHQLLHQATSASSLTPCTSQHSPAPQRLKIPPGCGWILLEHLNNATKKHLEIFFFPFPPLQISSASSAFRLLSHPGWQSFRGRIFLRSFSVICDDFSASHFWSRDSTRGFLSQLLYMCCPKLWFEGSPTLSLWLVCKYWDRFCGHVSVPSKISASPKTVDSILLGLLWDSHLHYKYGYVGMQSIVDVQLVVGSRRRGKRYCVAEQLF